MNKVQRLLDQLRRAFHGEAWHGPALTEILSGVTAEEAAAKPLPQRHSIWEILGHVIATKEMVGWRLDGKSDELTTAQDWPTFTDTSETAWQQTLEQLLVKQAEIEVKVAKLTDEQLLEIVPARDHSFYFALHGLVQHDLYHAGQIAVLRIQS